MVMMKIELGITHPSEWLDDLYDRLGAGCDRLLFTSPISSAGFISLTSS